MSGLRSNWGASVEVAVWGSSGEVGDDGEAEAVPRVRKRGTVGRAEVIGLAEAALVLGMRPEGSGWRRRVLRRLRAMERDLGVRLCATRKGRNGSLVSLDVLRRACPLPFVGLEQGGELRSKVRELEDRLARVERLIGAKRLRPDASSSTAGVG